MLLRCLPREEAFQHVCNEQFTINEEFWYRERRDGLGNRIIITGTDTAHTFVDYACSGIVETTIYCIPDSAPHPMFSLPSRLTQPSREMLTLMPRLTGSFLNDCLALSHEVHRYLAYTPGATHILTTAQEAYRLRQGVCQDYSHLMISLCRAVGIPARYVCGLMMGEGQTHAWVEAYDGQCWYAFDPTNDTAIASGYIKLAHGRDAQDCPVSRGTYIGITQQHTFVNVSVKEI